MTTVSVPADETSDVDVRPPYTRGDKLIVIATDVEVIYWVTLSDGQIEVVDKGKIRHFRPSEVRLVDEPVPSPEQVEVRQIADSLRNLAAYIESSPELAGALRSTSLNGSDIGIPIVRADGDAREAIGRFIAAARRAGAALTEVDSGTHAGVRADFGRFGLHVYAQKILLGDPPSMSAEEWGDSELDQDRVPTAEGYAEYLAYRPLLGVDTTTGGAE